MFASVSMMETAYQIKTGDKREFSQQSIGDCAIGDVKKGANVDTIMNYVMSHGVRLYEDAPFLHEVIQFDFFAFHLLKSN